jgi:putative Mg2+ transporter-C (MgtC) family protein
MFTHLVVNHASLAIFYKLGIAVVCGALIGTERVISHKDAGMRTYALVAMGAALFVIVSDTLVRLYASQGSPVGDPLQIPSMIISGIGFIGAGMIIFRETNVTGLTTAAGFWVVAGIGMACGYGLYIPAAMATPITLFVFIVLWHVEQHVRKIVWQEEPAPKKRIKTIE